ncbi:hypothetical protein BVX97_01355 [bacterium E08(2017)]|nr:hypothetical protein BVX97_01355 [bacterium E08(2017)]
MKDKVDFIGIGAEKSGSSWVCQCLESHPEIGFSAQCSDRELNFFNEARESDGYALWPSQYELGLDWYLEQFPDGFKTIGEFSCSYFFDKAAPERIKDAFPDVKILATLRNPVDMIYSVYWWHKSGIRSKVPPDFDKAVADGNYEGIEAFRGLYHKHLEKYLGLFDKNQVHVVLLDDIRKNPSETAKSVFEFLEVDSGFSIVGLDKKVNPARKVRSVGLMSAASWFNNFMGKVGVDLQESYARGNVVLKWLYSIYASANLSREKYPDMKPETRKMLMEYYADDIGQLSALISRDLGQWKKVDQNDAPPEESLL